MNSNDFLNHTAAISIPNAGQEKNLAQPIDIAYQRSGPVYNSINQPQQSASIQQQQQILQQLNNPGSININFNNNNQRLRRDSIAHSQGVGGISWGSVTIGSWLKDEVLMHSNISNYGNNNINNNNNGNSIANQMSPPIQSAYLPDLEANYCKDYSCCGQLLPTLHDLLKHYEESHISPTPPTHHPKPLQNFDTVSTTDVFINSNSNNPVTNNNNNNSNINNSNNRSVFGFNQSPFQQSQQQQQTNIQQQLRQQFNHSNNNNNHQNNHINDTRYNPQFNSSQFGNQRNQNNHHAGNIRQNNQSQAHDHNQSQHAVPFPMSVNNDDNAMDIDEEMDEGYIDDPSRNLYVAQGNEKPFTCPVIGCNKTYKNQNGLKYHRLHGHQNQKLHLNPDGTYSVIDPNDGNGMEQDKPYRCEVCGKRYKNLNGLKYHRGHSTH